jgi:hypothetical protein
MSTYITTAPAVANGPSKNDSTGATGSPGSKLPLNHDDALAFLAALDPSTNLFTFQTFDDDADRKSENAAYVFHGSLDQNWDDLAELNRLGAGVFVTINQTDLRGRARENIKRVRALFVDLDGTPLPTPDAFHVKPHIVVESSPGKWHCYWLVTNCDREQFEALQRRLIRNYDSDKSVHDLPRVMRLPGFVHQKVKKGVACVPFVTQLAEAHDHDKYAVEDFVRGLPGEGNDAAESSENDGAGETNKINGKNDGGGEHKGGEPEAEIGRIAAAVAVIPNDKESWDDWNKTGMAIYAATGGSHDGFRIFDVWSQQHPSYDAEHTRLRWDAYDGCPPNRIGAGSIFDWAQKACPGYETIAAAFPDNEVTKRIAAFMKAAGIEPAQPEEPKPEEPENKFFSTWWCDVRAIPRRRWLYGQHYIRGHGSTTVADGGMGKTTHAIIEGICVATGRPLLGQQPQEQCNVWYWNGEEPRHEIARRVHAVCVRYGIDPRELAGTFKFTSGLDEMPIKIAAATKGNVVVDDTLYKNLAAQIRDNSIGLLFLDPFISCHGAPENDNVAIDVVVKTWARLAAETNCAIELPHHTRKAARGDNGDAQAADARGAGALINAVRSCRVFNPMSEKEAGEFDVQDRFDYFRVTRGKANMIRRAGSWWYRLVSVDIGNADSINPNDFGDSVQTIVAWEPPDAMRDVTTAHAYAVRAKLAAGEYLRDSKSKDRWVGAVIAEVIGLGPDEDRDRIEKIIKAWINRGVIKTVRREDPKTRHERTFVEPTEDWTE